MKVRLERHGRLRSMLRRRRMVPSAICQFVQIGALRLLSAYKWAISPLLPPACRYVPTCSEYAIEAIERYGLLRGAVMAASRLLRCHPWVRGGFDPVPYRGDPDHPRMIDGAAG